MKRTSLNPKTAFFALSAVVGLIIAGSIGTYYLVYTTLRMLNRDLQRHETERAAYDARLTYLTTKLVPNYKKTRDSLARIEAALPESKVTDDPDSPKYLSDLTVQLKKLFETNLPARVTLKSITFGGQRQNDTGRATADPRLSQALQSGDLLAINLSLTATGSFQNIVTTLRRLEKLSRLTSIYSVSFARVPETGEVSATIEMNVFLIRSSS